MASEWPNIEKANDNWGDAQYGWEAAAEQMQNWQQWGTSSEKCHYYLHLSDVVDSEEDVIWWVDTIEELVDATSYFSSAEVKVVGMDCEWKPNYLRGEDPNQVSILQIATGKKVLIFDLIGLFEREPNALDTCLKVVFHSPNILKLGYAFHQDLEQLFESYTNLECFHFCDGILDLQKLYGSSKGGLSGLAKTLLGSELNKERRMSNWERRPLTPSQLHYAALDAAVLIAIFDVLCCEPSSRGSSGTQDTSHWKSLVTCCTTSTTHKRNPEVLPEADLAGAVMGELADNQTCCTTSTTHKRNPEVLPEADLAGAVMGELADNQDFRRNSGSIGPRSVEAKWQTQPKPVSQATSSKARVVGRLGPAGGCWTCGGDHFQNKCPENPDTTTKPTARIYASVNRFETDNQASLVGLQGTTSRRGRRNAPWSISNPRQAQYTTTKQNHTKG